MHSKEQIENAEGTEMKAWTDYPIVELGDTPGPACNRCADTVECDAALAQEVGK